MPYQKNSELKVITAAKDLCSYILTTTNKSPKSFRFTLVSRLQNLSLDIVEKTYKANDIFIKDNDECSLQKRLELQRCALTDVKVLSYLSLVAFEQGCILPKQYKQISKLTHDCQYLLGAWIKSSKIQ